MVSPAGGGLRGWDFPALAYAHPRPCGTPPPAGDTVHRNHTIVGVGFKPTPTIQLTQTLSVAPPRQRTLLLRYHNFFIFRRIVFVAQQMQNAVRN